MEDEITRQLVSHGGYLAVKGRQLGRLTGDFDPRLGLDTAELFAFIEATQHEAWAKLVKAHGGDETAARGRGSCSGWPRRSMSAGRSTCSATASAIRA